MPLSFANPALLFGALASALPVIIHLISRRRVRRVPFSDLRFLDDVQSQQARNLGLRRWLLLLLRVLALLLIALAAAQPRWGGLAASGRGARSVLFVLDTSASMQTQFRDATRLDAARSDLDRMLGALPGDASVQILTAGAVTAPRFDDWLPAAAAAGAGRDIPGTDGALDEVALLREAARQVSRAPGTPVEIVFLGDLQSGPEPDDLADAARKLTDAGPVQILLRAVGTEVPGGGILRVDLPGRSVLPGESITLRTLVDSDSPEEVVRLDLDGHMIAESVSRPAGAAGGAQFLDFALHVPETGIHRGRVYKESDAFPGDDVRPFVLKVPEVLRVLMVHGRDRPVDGPAGRGGWRFLRRALEPGSAAGAFRVRSMDSGELTTEALGAADVAVFVDPDPLGRQATGGLERWLDSGGAACFVLGEATQANYLASTLLPLLQVGGDAVWHSQPAGTGQRMSIVDAAHPVFRDLESDALETLSEVRVRGWFAIDEAEHRVLLTLTGEDPLLIEGERGQGRFALLTCHLEPAASDLPGSPMALPLFQRLFAWLADHSRLTDAVNIEVGQEALVRPRVATSVLDDPEALRVSTPAGGRTARLQWRGDQPVLSGGTILQAGQTVFEAQGDTVGWVAAGLPAGESVRGVLSPAQWQARWTAAGLPMDGDLGAIDPDSWTRVLDGADLTAWFLLVAILLLVTETLLGRGARPSD